MCVFDNIGFVLFILHLLLAVRRLPRHNFVKVMKLFVSRLLHSSIFTRQTNRSFSHRLDIGHIPASVIVITLTPTIKMFSRFQKPVSTIGRQLSTSSVAHRNVAVMGASGGKIDNPISHDFNYFVLLVT